jgi:hypothetical protein
MSMMVAVRANTSPMLTAKSKGRVEYVSLYHVEPEK